MTSTCTLTRCLKACRHGLRGGASRSNEQCHRLEVIVLEPAQSLSARQAAARRADPEDMVVIIEDLLKLLEGIGEGYRKGRHPDARTAKPVAQLLRKVAADLEA